MGIYYFLSLVTLLYEITQVKLNYAFKPVIKYYLLTVKRLSLVYRESYYA